VICARGGLDQHEIVGRIDPLEVEACVGVDRGIQSDSAVERIRGDPIQVPVPLFELVPAPEHGLEKIRGDLADTTCAARYCMDPALGPGRQTKATDLLRLDPLVHALPLV